MAEEAPIRRLRRLLGDQRFDDEAQKGKALREQAEAAERTKREAAQAEERKQLAARAEFAAMDDQVTLRAVSHEPKHENTKSQPANRRAPAKPTTQTSAAKQKIMRPKPKGSPYSDTEYETDSDADDPAVFQQAAPTTEFCPVFAVNKYPYKYLGANKDFMEKVANTNWNNGQFFNRKWTIFYVHPPDIISASAIFFVPAKEVRSLFDETSNALGVDLSIPSSAGFQIEFTASEPRPVFLGTSFCREDFDDMCRKVPVCQDDVRGAWTHDNGDDRAFKVWQAKLEEAISASKQKKARSKAQAQQKRSASKQQWCRQLRRSQRYLGLRAPNEAEAKGAAANFQDETAALQAINIGDDYERLPDIDVTEPPQFAFDQDVVFVCIDIEAHETMQTQVTEIGLSTLDTRDLKSVAPGKFAENWRSLIKYRHFRVNEYKHHTNSRFVSGCPDRFEKTFGESEFIGMHDIAKVVATCCKPPFPHTANDRALVEAGASQDDTDAPTYEPRKIVLVGHNFESDVDYLKRSGIHVLKLAGLVEVLDTSMIHRALVHEINPINLASVLNLFGIAGWNLHNAGNDAGYTLQALLAMAVDNLVNPEYRKTEEDRIQRRETTMRLAGEREDSDFQEWLQADRSVVNSNKY